MHTLNSNDGWITLFVYGVLMTILVSLFTKPDKEKDDHLVASRSVSPLFGAFSIAVTWIWAPAIFVCGQKAFEEGLAGLFWFTFPNVLCFFTFVPIALLFRKKIPNGYSLPDYIFYRFNGDASVHLAYVFVSICIQLGAIVMNSLAGGLLLETICGMDKSYATITIAGIALFYSIWRGLPASIITDFVQMTLILFIAFVVVPWVVVKSDGLSTIHAGLAGTRGSINIFDPWIAYSFGIPTTIGLMTFPVADQMFFQRVMASRAKDIAKTFIYGGLVFAIIPVLLSSFGFIGAALTHKGIHTISSAQMVNSEVVSYFLPSWTLYAFILMTLCALSSTLDSAYCAVGSLVAVDIYQRYLHKSKTAAAKDSSVINASKIGMLVFTILGTSIALIPDIKILWMFLIVNCLASVLFLPTIVSLYSERVGAKTVAISIIAAFLFSLPLSIYANVIGNPHLIVLAACMTLVLSGAVCWIGIKLLRTVAIQDS